MTLFLRVLSQAPGLKGDALRDKIRQAAEGVGGVDFDLDAAVFAELPRCPFAYWSSQRLREVFKTLEPFESANRTARVGLQTSDDFRFVRAWWETSAGRVVKRWFTFVRGGQASKFYGALHLCINWGSEGEELKAWAIESTGGDHWSKNIRSADMYLRPGITWPLRAAEFSPYPMPAGSLFSTRGSVAFCAATEIESIIGLFGSRVFDRLFKLLLGRTEYPEFSIGTLQLLPTPEVLGVELGVMARRSWSLKRRLAAGNETIHDFVAPLQLLNSVSPTSMAALKTELEDIQRRIDAVALEIFGLDVTDLDDLDANSSAGDADELGRPRENEDGSADDTFSIISWSVGVAFARFDIRLTTGERAIPPEPDPFDPLPAKSPGMLLDGDAPLMPTSGVFVDDPGHADDLVARVTAVHERVGKSTPSPEELRWTMAREFFPAHIRMYSKSRRKAPIYWQLATPSARYSVWLYIHAFSKDTLFRVQNDYVAPKVAHERRALEGLRAEAGPSPTTAQSRAIEAQTSFVEELSAMLEEVGRVAPLWDPDLDDGVILNFAPLWRLVPQNRAWQKELRAAWAALVAGDYDWAHLAMRLWPERVVPKCATDRSVAIAHDLEDVFWFEDGNGKWQPHVAPTIPLDTLVVGRTQASVKAALANLIGAAEPAGSARRGRAARAA